MTASLARSAGSAGLRHFDGDRGHRAAAARGVPTTVVVDGGGLPADTARGPIHEIVFMQARLRLGSNDLDAAERYIVEAIGIAAVCESRPILGEALVMSAALLELRQRDDVAQRLIELCADLTTRLWNPHWYPLLPPNTRNRLRTP